MFLISGLGNGWDIARINNNVEYMFINQTHISDYYQLRYFIGGGTDDHPSDTVKLSQNFGFSDNGMILDQFISEVHICVLYSLTNMGCIFTDPSWN